jgi:hypothetical protein
VSIAECQWGRSEFLSKFTVVIYAHEQPSSRIGAMLKTTCVGGYLIESSQLRELYLEPDSEHEALFASIARYLQQQ